MMEEPGWRRCISARDIKAVERCYGMGVCHLGVCSSLLLGMKGLSHILWYRYPTEAQQCGHTITNIGDDNFPNFRKEYDVTESVHCPIWKQCYHKSPFHV